MKYNITLLMALVCSGCVMAEPRLKATFHVSDAESGSNLTNSSVTVYNDGWETKNVDENGNCSFEGEGMSFGWKARAKSDGYYDSEPRAKFSSINHILGRWEPWNPTVEVKMRPKKNPVPMVHKQVEWKFKIPNVNVPIGFDLVQGDWTKPYGKGQQSDLFFEIIPLMPSEKGSQLRISFPNSLDGIQEHEFKWPNSSFKWPYLAPTNGYHSVLDKYYVLNFPKVRNVPEHNLKKDANYLIRTRTKVDKESNIASACYGFFTGEIDFTPRGEFNFQYWFNPVPNERSLEWNSVNLHGK